jgi:hypothetical protein
LNNTYLIKEKNLKKALDQVDNFKTKMEMFLLKYPNYIYNVKFNKELDKWLFKLNIQTKNEQTNTQTS